MGDNNMKNENILKFATTVITRICPYAVIKQAENGSLTVAAPSLYSIDHKELEGGWTVGDGASCSDLFADPEDAVRGLAVVLLHNFINESEDAIMAEESIADRKPKGVMCSACLNLVHPDDMETLTKCKACSNYDEIPRPRGD
jgi:hypothetical protein